MPQIKQSELIREARRWLGTPFHHQASLLGVGADCGGLAIGVYSACGLDLSAISRNYPRQPSHGSVEKVIGRFLDRTSLPVPGDLVVFRFLLEPHHIGILVGDNRVIHSYEGYGGVVEHLIDSKWSRRIVSYWHYRGLVT